MSKDRKYLSVEIHNRDGNVWENDLMLNEVYLIKTLLRQENTDYVVVRLNTIPESAFKNKFS